ncbi:hypothetical protein N0B51_11640 [Tsuneonella sp. YG55]|uniref:Uncharacterized protein n=1 Tax=Tsuneonella litorea TaxID=2976475 RepID=A0A9X2W229_9SPHN|nr:hypothetical protein [Tsuneonella litorea]MCT2559632.1 hypothetical protein [Tsuneonella litorea]
MLRHVIRLAEKQPVRAFRRRILDRQSQFEARLMQSFEHMRERDQRVDA